MCSLINLESDVYMMQLDILLVDDSPEVAELSRIALDARKFGDRMRWFGDAETAAEYLFSQQDFAHCKDLHPRLVLLDLHLPLMSGHELLALIKTNPATAHIPVVMFSSSDDQSDIVHSYQLGANGYLLKASDPREFIDTVADAASYWLRRNQAVR